MVATVALPGREVTRDLWSKTRDLWANDEKFMVCSEIVFILVLMLD